MSGTFDKRSDGASRREARAQKERLEKRKTRIIAVSVITVLAVLFAGALFINSKYSRRTLAAISIGGVNFSAAEFEYFYINAFHEYREYLTNTFGEYADSMLPPTQSPPFINQINQDTGEPWSETFIELAVANISKLVQVYSLAVKAGFVLPPDAREELDSGIDMFMMEAAAYGYTFDNYLQLIYGPNFNESAFRRVAEISALASEYSLYMRDSFEYSQADKDAYYKENKDTLDLFTFRYFFIRAETPDQDDFETTEEYDAAVEEALAEAIRLAEEAIDMIETEDDFLEAAKGYDEEQFGEPDSTRRVYPGSWLGTTYGPWLMEPERVYGDLYTTDISTGAYVVLFIERDPNEYKMTSMRQILILRDEIDADDFFGGEEDPDYLIAVEAADAAARAQADALWDLFVSGGKTEDLLLELMPDYSDDPTEGGFYEQISKDASQIKLVEELEDWLFDPVRKFGDAEMIRTEMYGYHLMFFMGHGDRYCDFVADTQMRDRDHTAWIEALEPVDAVRRWAFVLVSL